ncbi:exodeoxyribonuclease VII small subunit [Salidesulfovibrio onnuriiensis]|uniref:exodeoxyribonuclease VII small subunit n=1 Tax=Salidesulfovibrio onnuriiensis TaxID=2583823 RepID=UPI0011CBCB25|nr:exodeoxyribonuclease VII small subunit [Salidesulfovibrio onnuriiensis]
MAEQTFEQRLERLREIVERLERGELPLEQGVALYKEGLELAKGCGRQLENARHEVKVVSEGLLREFEALDGFGAEGDE